MCNSKVLDSSYMDIPSGSSACASACTRVRVGAIECVRATAQSYILDTDLLVIVANFFRCHRHHYY